MFYILLVDLMKVGITKMNKDKLIYDHYIYVKFDGDDRLYVYGTNEKNQNSVLSLNVRQSVATKKVS
ncbi:hypothetical protein HMPREF1250_0271 [Megasphaera vaginalis (ex Srinivasan et al. 2021)]|uniref:Uncharacterized protein n=1 Tax=Megasphaera vaginalis (ex Srinivasan et al. 2021) TaxID=1111454 RepID=U7UN97_9FIRM|nr:hypothetical protein HMPREF1250_0271 [Megasphaera vaginalis (ex Srinivasan et al. 2021)]